MAKIDVFKHESQDVNDKSLVHSTRAYRATESVYQTESVAYMRLEFLVVADKLRLLKKDRRSCLNCGGLEMLSLFT